jgi:transposase
LSLKSIKKYENMLNNGLVEEIITIKGNSRKSELDDYKEEILSELESGEYKTLRQIAAMIKSKTGLIRSRQRINVFLKKTATAQSK